MDNISQYATDFLNRYTPQYVTDFLKNYYKLTKRLLSVVEIPDIVLAPDVVEDFPLFVRYVDRPVESILLGTYFLAYESGDDEVYHYWWRGNQRNLNRIMFSLLESIDDTIEHYIRIYGIVQYKAINAVNELLNMSDEEFALYIKMIGLPLSEF